MGRARPTPTLNGKRHWRGPARDVGLAGSRCVLRAGVRCRDLGHAAGAHGPRDIERLLPGGPQRRLVPGRWLVVRFQHRLRAPGRVGRDGGRERRRGGPVRDPRLADPPPPRVAVRALLPGERRFHHAGVPRAQILGGSPLVLGSDLHHRLCADQDLGDDRGRGHRVRSAHGDRFLDGCPGGRGRDRRVHDLRRPAGGPVYGPAADVRPHGEP